MNFRKDSEGGGSRLPARKSLQPILLGLALACGLACWSALEVAHGPGHVEAGSEAETAGFPIKNPIDKFILAKLQEAKLEPSGVCTDEEFIRRASLDVVGVIPSATAVKAFLADRAPNKRAKLIDSLLKNERYGDHWAALWGDLLREHSASRPKEGTVRGSYRTWLQEALESNLPYDQFVSELITANGRAEENAAANFFLRDENNRVETVNTVATVFMGARMACAQCHDHPFDKWEQKDFHGLLAFLDPRTAVVPDQAASIAALKNARGLAPEIMAKLKPYIEKAEAELKATAEGEKKVGGASPSNPGMNAGGGMGMAMGMDAGRKGAKEGIRGLEQEIEKELGKEKAERFRQVVQQNQIRKVVERPVGEYRMPADGDGQDKKNKNSGETVEPAFPWDRDLKPAPRSSRRAALAKFVTGTHQFAEVQANRLWRSLFGRGIVDPVDDFREKNPPTHPELLAFLADELIKSKFDNKQVLRLILTSSAYERSSMPNASNKSDGTLYSHQLLRRMTAEQVFDSLLVATGRSEGLKGSGGQPRDVLAAMDVAGGKRPGAGKGAKGMDWAIDLPTPARTGSFMNLFNQPDREQIVTEREASGSVSQALEMLNGKAVSEAVAVKPGTLGRILIDAKKDGVEIATELFLATLSRLPTAAELNVAKAVLKGKPPANEAVEDFHWALINTREFVFIK